MIDESYKPIKRQVKNEFDYKEAKIKKKNKSLLLNQKKLKSKVDDSRRKKSKIDNTRSKRMQRLIEENSKKYIDTLKEDPVP